MYLDLLIIHFLPRDVIQKEISLGSPYPSLDILTQEVWKNKIFFCKTQFRTRTFKHFLDNVQKKLYGFLSTLINAGERGQSSSSIRESRFFRNRTSGGPETSLLARVCPLWSSRKNPERNWDFWRFSSNFPIAQKLLRGWV